jgi:FkbM family methyltransferase
MPGRRSRQIVRGVRRHPLRRRLRRTRLAAAAVRPRSGFLVGELRGGIRAHALADGGIAVVRHRSRDIDLVVEIFGPRRAYEPPASLASRLAGPVRILDLGGNIGLFAIFALQRYDVRVITSLEPDPENAAVLARAIQLNGAGDRWRLQPVAVASAAGPIRFITGRLLESRRAEPGEPGVELPAVDLFDLEHRVDLLKLDIEGGEWTLLGDPRLADLGARIIVLEWHALGAPDPDAHAAALGLLQRAGYVIHLDEVDPPHGHTGLVWAARP